MVSSFRENVRSKLMQLCYCLHCRVSRLREELPDMNS